MAAMGDCVENLFKISQTLRARYLRDPGRILNRFSGGWIIAARARAPWQRCYAIAALPSFVPASALV
ncbi:hypothetical protein ASE39_07300 [Acidovorax sp. Root267]|nr:hypothetical protein ASE39_07300 [Acidovorax sp. Root267]